MAYFSTARGHCESAFALPQRLRRRNLNILLDKSGWSRELAGGGTPAQRDCVAANLALLILLGKKAVTLPEAVASARRTLENGAGLRVLAHLREKSAEGERRAA